MSWIVKGLMRGSRHNRVDVNGAPGAQNSEKGCEHAANAALNEGGTVESIIVTAPLQICASEEDLRLTGELRKACSRRGAAKQPPTRVNTTSRLLDLRHSMQNEIDLSSSGVDAYIITSDDEHQTEYVARYDRRREYITGFSGSSGDAIVTLTKAVLWTDGRYHLQADDQLNCDWLLMREGQSKIPTKAEWLLKELPNGGRVGADPKLISASTWNLLESDFANTSLKLVAIENNLIDKIWGNHFDSTENKTAFVLEEMYSGKNWVDKVDETRKELTAMGVDAMVVTSLAEIAWLLNIRGRDIPYNPFVRSYVMLSMNEVRLYVNKNKVEGILKHFITDSESVTIHDYDKIWQDIPTRSQAWRYVLIPSASAYSSGASRKIYSLVKKHKRIYKPSPIINLKAKKNPTEITGMEMAHIRDAAAMCEFLEYVETRFNAGDAFNEMQLAQILNDIRYEQNYSLGNSFETIVAFGSNGALPHYEPTVSTNTGIFDNSTLVIDSGGQYYDGTTDVTRTLHFGQPTEDQIKAYTRVLMGSIQLSSLIFPAHLKMQMVDVMARAPLWEVGLDYLHGTSHGIGSFLGVHEPPIAISFNSQNGKEHFKPGYFFSNEPGYYNDGEFGVRLENILEVVSKPWFKHLSGRPFLGFKDVTLVPYEPKLININLLSVHHRRWLNNYNTRIRESVGKLLKERNKMGAFYWMMEKTKHIPGHGNRISTYPTFLLFFNILAHITVKVVML